MSLDSLSETFSRLQLTQTKIQEPEENIVTLSNCDLTNNELINSDITLIETMAQFKPEYLNCVPQFDGNPNELNRYLGTCESIINSFYDVENPNSFHNVYLLNSLISKLTGNAKLIVNIQNATTWVELKDTLYRNFADQRDEACLNRDLVLLRQNPNEKPQQFFDRCLQILNLLCSYVDIHEADLGAKLLKRDLYNKLALKTFIAGLKEPLGTTIRCMRPTNMNEALQFIMQEENIHYYQNSTNKPYFKQIPTVQNQLGHNRSIMHNQRPINNFPRPQFNFGTQNNQLHPFKSNFTLQQPQFQMGYNRASNQPSNQPPNFFRNSQVFRQPQQNSNQNIFRQNQNNFRPNQNVFKPNQNTFFTKPTPMSICTRQSASGSQQRPSQTPAQSQQRNFIAEELYNTEVDEIGQINQYHNEQFIDNENTELQEVSVDPYENNAEPYYEEDVNFQIDPLNDNQT